MRLALVTNDYPPKAGGIQQYLLNLVDAWPDDVLVLGPADPAARQEDPTAIRRGNRTFMWPTRWTRRWVIAAARDFEAEAVLFGAPYPLAWMAADVGRELGVPTAVLCHGAEVTVPASLPVARTLVRRSLRGADALLAVSRFTRNRVERLTGREAHYVGSGVDAGLFSPATGDSDRQAPVIGCVSRFVPRKGQHRLIAAAAEMRRGGREVSLLFVGSGRRLRALRSMANKMGVDARFEVGVPWSALPGLYRQMDVFCMPCRSRWLGLEVEGLGIVYLEAAASGLPVLAGDSGGAPEAVIPGRTGFVVHSISDIVEGATMLLDHPERRADLGENGRAHVLESYAWPLVAQRVEEAISGSR